MDLIGQSARMSNAAVACTAQNQLVVFADDTHPRWLTAVAQLDYDTMAGTDKFGNMFIARLPADVSATIENDPSGAKVFIWSSFTHLHSSHVIPRL